MMPMVRKGNIKELRMNEPGKEILLYYLLRMRVALWPTAAAWKLKKAK